MEEIVQHRPPEIAYVSDKSPIIATNNTSGIGTPKTSSEVTLQCAQIAGKSLNIELSRISRAKFTSTCGEHAICTLVSKDHKGEGKYWYGIFDHQLEWFDSLDVPNKWYVIACGGPGLMFRIPLDEIIRLNEKLSSRDINRNGKENTYWHVNIKNIDGQWKILTLKEFDDFILEDYKID